MQVYRHPDRDNYLVLSVRDSPMTHSILKNCEFASEMEYNAQQEWYTMTNETYQKLRRQLAPSSVLLANKTAKRQRAVQVNTPVTPPIPVVPVERLIRTLPTQTDPPPVRKESATQTEEQKETNTEHPNIPVPVEVQSSTIVLPVPPLTDQLPTPSPSQLVYTKGPESIMPNELVAEEVPLAVLDPPTSIHHVQPPPPSTGHGEGQSVLSGYMDWRDVCLRRLLVRDMLRERE